MFVQNAKRDLPLSNSPGIVGPSGPNVSFDEENLSLEGRYGDEIRAYRAKRTWTEVLRSYFLLERAVDYTIEVKRVAPYNFTLNLHFTSPCGRYAFWKLSTDQALEAQYAIEVAHLPVRKNCKGDGVLVPEMRAKGKRPSEALWKESGEDAHSKESLLIRLARKIGERLLYGSKD